MNSQNKAEIIRDVTDELEGSSDHGSEVSPIFPVEIEYVSTEERGVSLDLLAKKDPLTIRKLLQQNEQLRRQNEQLQEMLDGILHSRSWRLTTPLRSLVAFKKALFPLFRFKRHFISPQPGRHILYKDGRYYVGGPSPSLLLDSRNSEIPSGWVTLRARLNSSVGRQHFFLYYSVDGRCRESERVLISLENGLDETAPILLPPRVTALRLDPIQTEESFDLRDIEICEKGKIQVVFHLLSFQLKPVYKNPRLFFGKAKKAFLTFREGGFTALRVKLFSDSYTSNYQEWVKKYDTITDQDRNGITKHIAKLQSHPLISLIMPTYNTPEKWLRLAIESVIKQLYKNWELCIADDASTEPHVKAILKEYTAKDSRIKLSFREKNGHISKSSNTALELATGEYIALLDHDDELSEHALYMVVNEINNYPDAGLLYSDEDKITAYGMHFNPYFKSDWNPDLLLSQNFVCHLLAFKTSVVREVGGFREGVEGAQDWDLILRVSERLKESQIRHIPHVLYHWRVVEGSTAQATSFKPYAMKAQARAVKEHLERTGVAEARVKILNEISNLKVSFPLPKEKPLVSLIIPTKDKVGLLKRCVGSINERTDYRNYEIIIVDNRSEESETFEYFESLKTNKQVKIISDQKPFNFSRINNEAVAHASGEILGFLNNDLEVICDEWLTEMVSHAIREEIGAVGAKLLYPNGLLQHAGVILGIGGVAGHNHKGRPRHDPGYFNRAILVQDLSAVTAACMLIRRKVFEEVGGFEEVELSVAFNDVDLCLRIREKGYRILYTPYAELYHYESASRGYENTPEKFMRFEGEIENMQKRWGDKLKNDPYYNPNLTLLTEDFAFAFPPRAKKPWNL